MHHASWRAVVGCGRRQVAGLPFCSFRCHGRPLNLVLPGLYNARRVALVSRTHSPPVSRYVPFSRCGLSGLHLRRYSLLLGPETSNPRQK